MRNLKFLGVLSVVLSIFVYASSGYASPEQSQNQPDTAHPEKTVRIAVEQSGPGGIFLLKQ